MDNTNFSYQNNNNLCIEGLAAGFPPFTLGYCIHNFKTSLITANNVESHFSLNLLNEKSIIEIFQKIDFKKSFKNQPVFKISFLFTGSINDIAYIQALRTLLSCLLFDAKMDTNIYKFHFTGIANADSFSLLNTINMAQIAQIDAIAFNKEQLNLCQILNYHSSIIPNGVFSNSALLLEKTNNIFNKIWVKIKSS